MSVFTSETLFYRTLCKRVLIKTDLSLLHRCQAKLSFYCILGITAFFLIYHFLNPWFLFLEQILQELFQTRTNFHAWPTVEYSLSRTVESAFTLHSHLKVPGLPWHSVLSNWRLKFSAPGSISYYLFFPILFLCPSGYLLGDTWGSPPTEHLTQVRTDSFLCLLVKKGEVSPADWRFSGVTQHLRSPPSEDGLSSSLSRGSGYACRQEEGGAERQRGLRAQLSLSKSFWKPYPFPLTCDWPELNFRATSPAGVLACGFYFSWAPGLLEQNRVLYSAKLGRVDVG